MSAVTIPPTDERGKLRGELKALKELRFRTERSDARAFINGKMAAIDRQIRKVEKNIEELEG